MLKFLPKTKNIKDIYDMFDKGVLIIDRSYQRRSVWNEKDKIRLIETILLHYVIPELFFWKASTDPETGTSITHIVDGQQRVTAIYSFINNEFCLKSQYLMDENIKKTFGNKYFKDLPPEPVRTDFWNYELTVIDIDKEATRSNIIEMFNRLNLTDYNLNNQEKRNSRAGEFASLALELSNDTFWADNNIFSNSDIKRMKDLEFCATIILLYKNGIIDQTDQSVLDDAYEEYQTGYDEAENDKNAVLEAIHVITSYFITEDNKKFIRKKSQMYTLFSIAFFIKRENIHLDNSVSENFTIFVKLYSVFTNATDLSSIMNKNETVLYDWLKRYKLASSEGINKHVNRMIRFNVLKDFLFSISPELSKARISLYDKLSRVPTHDLGNNSLEEDDE